MADFLLLLRSLPLGWLLGAALLLGMGLVYGVLSLRLSRLQRRYQDEMEHVQRELVLMASSARGLGRKLGELERQQRVVEERLDQFSLKEPGEQVFHHAVRLLKNGADIDTVMEQSGLSRGEVELLQRMNDIVAESARSSMPA